MPLYITIPDSEAFDEKTNQFIQIKGRKIQLEHSLKSVALWESKWHKPYISREQKTKEELVDYIRCMSLTKDVDPITFYYIPESEIQKIVEYIEDPMTATTFREEKKGGVKDKIVTSEILYYDMIALNIPWECEKWHLNRLITLIRVCSEKNKPEKKMSKNDIYRRNRALNAARRAKLGTKG